MIWGRIKAWAIAAGALALAVLGAFLSGYRKGGQDKAAESVRRRVEAAREAQEVRDDVEDMGDAERRDDLSKWMRDRER